MNEIGGYFELELKQGNFFHNGLITLNSARNCLVYLLREKQIAKLHLPYYNCSAVVDAVRSFCLETEIHFYHIDDNFKPILGDLPADEYLFYVNYFGLQDRVIEGLPRQRLIIDNAQAFYSSSIPDADTIYCPRKFFGVNDGGVLRTNLRLDKPLDEDISWEHAIHLLKRIDCSASSAYPDFQSAEHSLSQKPLKRMSRLTKRILSSIDYVTAREKRVANFTYVHSRLSGRNEMSSIINNALAADTFVPFCYPFKTQNTGAIRSGLIENKIYVPTYWPELLNSSELNHIEMSFVNNIVCLPIDQRYGEAEMVCIIDCLKKLLS